MRARRVRLSEADDAALREVEQGAGWREKVRLRAKVVRLSHRGMSAREITAYTGRHLSSVLRDFSRWEQRGLAGLADGAIPGRRSPIGEAARAFLTEKLSEERGWTAQQLAATLQERFGLSVNRESLRVCLRHMGYTWQRQRYVPVKQPDAELLATKRQELDELKKKPSGRARAQVSR